MVVVFKLNSRGKKRYTWSLVLFYKVNLKDILWSWAQQNFSLDIRVWKMSGMWIFFNLFTVLELLISFIVVENWSFGRGIKWNKILSFIAGGGLLSFPQMLVYLWSLILHAEAYFLNHPKRSCSFSHLSY